RRDARALGDRLQLLVADTGLQLEFDEHARKVPVTANHVDYLRGADEPQPEFRFVAADLTGGPVFELRPGLARPGARLGIELCARGRRVDARGEVIADRRGVHDRVQPA